MAYRTVSLLCLLALCGGSGWRRDGVVVSGPAPRWRHDGALSGYGATGWRADGAAVSVEEAAAAVVDFPVTDGLSLWFDFTDESSVTLDGTAVLSVADKSLSGNGATSTAAPTGAGTYDTVSESVPHVVFGGANSIPLLQSPLTVTSEHTIFIVFQPYETSGTYMCPVADGIYQGTPAGNSMFYLNLGPWMSANYLFYTEGLAGWDGTGAQYFDYGNRYVYTARISAHGSSFGWVNGRFDQSAYNGLEEASFSRAGLLVGGPSYGVHNWNGAIYEVAYFDRLLEQAELVAIAESLAEKYGTDAPLWFSEEPEAMADVYFDPGENAWVDPDSKTGIIVPAYIGELPIPEHSSPYEYTFLYWVDDQYQVVDEYYYLTSGTSMTLYAVWDFVGSVPTYRVDWEDADLNTGGDYYDMGTEYSSFLPGLPPGYIWYSNLFGSIGYGSGYYVDGDDMVYAMQDL